MTKSQNTNNNNVIVLSKNQQRILSALNKTNKETNIAQLRDLTGIQKGYSRVLLPMEENGWIEATQYEGETRYWYTLTSTGKKALTPPAKK